MIAIKGMKIPKSCIGCGIRSGVFCYYKKTPFELNEVDMLDERPSDCPLVEIVTCKECKYYRNKEDKYSYCTKRLNVDSITDRYREPDYYCANGERRENDNRNNS